MRIGRFLTAEGFIKKLKQILEHRIRYESIRMEKTTGDKIMKTETLTNVIETMFQGVLAGPGMGINNKLAIAIVELWDNNSIFPNNGTLDKQIDFLLIYVMDLVFRIDKADNKNIDILCNMCVDDTISTTSIMDYLANNPTETEYWKRINQ